MTLRIAFTGAHGTGKDQLVAYTSKLLDDFGFSDLQRSPVDNATLPSATRWVSEVCNIGHSEEADDWTQLWSAVRRRFWEFEELNNATTIVLSPRCGVDEIAYQQRIVDLRVAEFQSAMALIPQLSMGPDERGNEQMALRPEQAEQQMYINRALAVLNILVEQAAVELDDFWDFIYWKRPYEGVKIENDGHRSTDEQFQFDIDECFSRYFTSGTAVAQLFSIKMKELPRELTEAKQYLRMEVARWKEQAGL